MYGTEDYTAEERFHDAKEEISYAFESLLDKLDSESERADRFHSQYLEAKIEADLADQRMAIAYTQRAITAVAFAHTVIAAGGTAGVGRDGREDQPDEWRVVLYVDTAAGQLSWHIAPADQHMLAGLPQYAGVWDGTWNSGDSNFYKRFINEPTL
jgi:hypothetical protein